MLWKISCSIEAVQGYIVRAEVSRALERPRLGVASRAPRVATPGPSLVCSIPLVVNLMRLARHALQLVLLAVLFAAPASAQVFGKNKVQYEPLDWSVLGVHLLLFPNRPREFLQEAWRGALALLRLRHT